MNEISWTSNVLKIGQSMTLEIQDKTFTISHVDRRVDPYLAGAIIKGVHCHTGLFATLGKAKTYLNQFT